MIALPADGSKRLSGSVSEFLPGGNQSENKKGGDHLDHRPETAGRPWGRPLLAIRDRW